jgi:hypothetical protein
MHDTTTIEIKMMIEIEIPVEVRTRIVREAATASVPRDRNARAEAAVRTKAGTIMKNGE